MKGKVLIVIIFSVVLLFFFTMSLGSLFDKQTISEQEKRELATRPALETSSVLSGVYFQGWENFIADHIPFRSQYLLTAERIKQYKGLDFGINVVQINADLGVPTEGDSPQPKQDVIILPDRLMEGYRSSKAGLDSYVNTVNQFASLIPSDITLYNMLIPLPIEFADQAIRSGFSPEKPDIDRIYRRLDPRIKSVDVYDALSKHAQESIYFRTDHHWTALGAYYGMTAFSEQAGFTPISLYRYDKQSLEGYLGQLYQMVPNEKIKEQPDTIDYYMLNGRNNSTEVHFYDEAGNPAEFISTMLNLQQPPDNPSYGIFLGGDYPLIVVDGTAKNGKVLAIVKDSFGNAFVPWLTPYYKQILVIDPRGFHGDFKQVLADYHVTDLLLLNYLKVTMLPAFMDYMTHLLY